LYIALGGDTINFNSVNEFDSLFLKILSHDAYIGKDVPSMKMALLLCADQQKVTIHYELLFKRCIAVSKQL